MFVELPLRHIEAHYRLEGLPTTRAKKILCQTLRTNKLERLFWAGSSGACTIKLFTAVIVAVS